MPTAPAPAAPAIPQPHRRIPKPHGGIQYNACKNPACIQYGLPAPASAARGGKGPYALVGGGKGYPLLKCNACGETPPLKSNAGIVEEIERLSAYLKPDDGPFCPRDTCANHQNKVPLDAPKAYRSFGTNAHGSKRVQCCLCKKTFVSSSKPAKGQHDSHLNREIFKMLVNQVALSRIVKMLSISWAVLYRRIDFIHAQCMAFVARRERRLSTMPIERLYLAIDAQDYLVNWTRRKDKRNVVLKAITAVDNKTGYVFCNALNFDETADHAAIEADARAVGDALLPAPHRKYARIWTNADYDASVKRSAAKPRLAPAGSLQAAIANQYARTQAREDVESFDEKEKEEALPGEGAQIHSEYTLIAMFHHLKAMVGACEQWRFFMDQESGIRAACLSAFRDEVLARRAEAFYVSIQKETTQEDKRHCMNDAKAMFDQIAAANPSLSDDEVRLLMIKQEIARQKAVGAFGDRWVAMPLPSMSEPMKSVCWLTEHQDFDDDHVAWLYNKASLHAVDTFFMKTRRSIAMCERPISSSANKGRIWSAYQSYKPSILKKVLEIFRVYNNFIDLPQGVKKDKRKTPAMRLGLADAPLDFKDILYFQ